MRYFSVPTSPEPELPYAHKSRRRWSGLPGFGGRYGTLVMFFGTAALAGVLFHLVAFSTLTRIGTYRSPAPALHTPTADISHPIDRPPLDLPDELESDKSIHHLPPPPSPASPPAGSSLQWMAASPPPNYHELPLEELRDLVQTTKGYFARDYSLGLGWNNMRYIIEAAMLQAQLLNRTLVLPSFVYARGCEYNINVCADYAPMVNKGDAIGWDEWRKLPIEQQMGWRLPMSLMLNLTHIRQKHPVILISDYLRLHGRPASEEHSNGAWHRDDYHKYASVFEEDKSKKPSLFVVQNHWYDPSGTIRVDYIPEEMKQRGQWNIDGGDWGSGVKGAWPENVESRVYRRLMDALPEGKSVLDWDTARRVLQDSDSGIVWDLSTDEKFEDLLQKNGWEVLHTFLGALGLDYTKTVVNPVKQVVPRSSLRGWIDEYGDVDADVLVLAGETHLYRKPGALRFTTAEARTDFADLVLHYLVPVHAVSLLSDRLAERMRAKVDGRLWMGAHMRRGDFVRLGWAMEADPVEHVKRVKERLTRGRETLEHLDKITTYDVPGVQANMEQLTLNSPLPTDPFYIATDERDPEALKAIAEHGAIFMPDLLEMDDLREFGWPLMLTDYRAVVEQHLLSHSAYFYAHGMSSVAGGIVNMRAARGADRHTTVLD